eukprot:TRINITY_DN42338_c0_g1_i1.p1 TRINITY_DN42338_c0_g1~~TRINITY_DN42338_c0_g1_i1.p1  ORF type:complete len:812 (+),score=173.63 TRINITY_DN42338_c0_g1_i1:66-2438(+)
MAHEGGEVAMLHRIEALSRRVQQLSEALAQRRPRGRPRPRGRRQLPSGCRSFSASASPARGAAPAAAWSPADRLRAAPAGTAADLARAAEAARAFAACAGTAPAAALPPEVAERLHSGGSLAELHNRFALGARTLRQRKRRPLSSDCCARGMTPPRYLSGPPPAAEVGQHTVLEMAADVARGRSAGLSDGQIDTAEFLGKWGFSCCHLPRFASAGPQAAAALSRLGALPPPSPHAQETDPPTAAAAMRESAEAALSLAAEAERARADEVFRCMDAEAEQRHAQSVRRLDTIEAKARLRAELLQNEVEQRRRHRDAVATERRRKEREQPRRRAAWIPEVARCTGERRAVAEAAWLKGLRRGISAGRCMAADIAAAAAPSPQSDRRRGARLTTPAVSCSSSSAALAAAAEAGRVSPPPSPHPAARAPSEAPVQGPPAAPADAPAPESVQPLDTTPAADSLPAAPACSFPSPILDLAAAWSTTAEPRDPLQGSSMPAAPPLPACARAAGYTAICGIGPGQAAGEGAGVNGSALWLCHGQAREGTALALGPEQVVVVKRIVAPSQRDLGGVLRTLRGAELQPPTSGLAKVMRVLHEDPAEDDGRSLCVVMEHVPGRTLADWLLHGEHAPSSIGALWGLAAQLAEGLDVLHEAGLLHGDVRPENVVIRPGGGPAAWVGMRFAPPHATVPSAWSPPSQLVGKIAGDLWGLGRVLETVGLPESVSEAPADWAQLLSHLRDAKPAGVCARNPASFARQRCPRDPTDVGELFVVRAAPDGTPPAALPAAPQALGPAGPV